MKSLKCRALRHDWDGHVYEEISKATSRLVWVARLECKECGTSRVDFMTPRLCELISRRYFYPDDYQSDLDYYQAKQAYFTELLVKNV